MFAKFAFLLVLGLAFEKVYADEPDRIVGGTDAALGEFPYQVSLRNGNSDFHFCGGTIVSNKHIITAAHCLIGKKLEDITVVSGSVKLDDPSGQIHRIQNYTLYPDYMADPSYSWVHDAGMITLAEPMVFNENQKPIPVAKADPPAKAPLNFTGWGAQRVGGRSPNHLQKATLYYVENEACQEIYGYTPIYYTHLCALHSAGIGACSGDSGGPLVYNGELVGIASWVALCARGVPDVFTKARYYEGFFDMVMREL